MFSLGSWLNQPVSLDSVLTDFVSRGTDLGVFLAAADLLVLGDGAALVLVLPPEQSRPSEGDRQEALRRGDRLSLPRLQLVPRTKCLNWELPESYGTPAGSFDGSLCTGPLVLSHLKPSMLSPSESTPIWAMPMPPPVALPQAAAAHYR
jgi:hypothetical protein